jgi:hypothetical protein
LHTHENILKDLKGELDGIYRSVNSNIVKGINSFFHARGDGSYMVHTPKLEKKEEDEGIGIYLPKEKFTPLIDVLRQIDRLSIYSAKFLHHTRTLHHRSPKSNALYASIIGYGCNISIPKMAKISKGISAHDIDHIRTWYLSPDMLQEANDAVLAFTESLDVPMLFRSNPHKNHTASDGQKFKRRIKGEVGIIFMVILLLNQSKMPCLKLILNLPYLHKFTFMVMLMKILLKN